MASAGQQLKEKRTYEYGYPNYAGLLGDIHNALTTKMKSYQMKSEAQTLQRILTEIKQVSSALAKNSKKIISQDLREKYENFINEIAQTQSRIRRDQGLSGGGGAKIFAKKSNDKSFRNKQVTKGADEIFEETFAVMLAVLQKKISGGNYHIDLSNVQSFLAGQGSADTSAAKAFADDLSSGMSEGLRKGLEQVTGQIIKTKYLKVGKSQKIDTQGFNDDFELDIELDFPEGDLLTMARLLKDATFTLKNYSSWGTYKGKRLQTGYDSLGLHLGKTNLFKAITGSIDRTITRNVTDQRDMYYRGLQTIIKADSPSASPEEVFKHFTHMRFMFELSGYGLVDETGKPLFAKFLIYNDPAGDAIYVRDTASIILEEFERGASAANLFGEMLLSASRVNSLQ